MRGVILALVAVYAVVFVFYRVGTWLGERGRHEEAPDRRLRGIPIVGKVRQKLAMARFCKVFHIYLLAAYPISRGLRSAGEAAQSGVLEAASDLAAEAVVRGCTLSEAVEDAADFPIEFVQGLATAEQTGTLDEELETWTRVFHQEAMDALRLAASWIPRIVYVVVAGFVIWQIFALGRGYFEIIEGMLDEIDG
ncbi:MAG: type II secretion system F family protein [Verrucomicrobiales bacterium]